MNDLYLQGRVDAIEEFISICKSKYPKNWANEYEFDGMTCYFSLNDICKIAKQIKEQTNEECE